MDFQKALTHIKNLKRVSREAWPSSFLFYRKGEKPYLQLAINLISNGDELKAEAHPWRPTQEDLLADDWRLVDE